MSMSRLRRYGFWTLDAIKGGKIRRHYLDIKSKLEDGKVDIDREHQHQIRSLIEHAKKYTQFYRDIKGDNLKDLPIVTKVDFKNNFDLFQSKYYYNKPLHKMSTSGSTGTPFTVYQNMNKRRRTLADIIYFNELCDQRLGDRYVFFRVWTNKNKKSKLGRLLRNLVPVDILNLSDESLERIRNLLKRDRYIVSTLGYASTYEHLAKYLKKNGDNPSMFNIKSMVSSSEVLDMRAKQLIKEVVGCKIIDRYSNQENGIIAQTSDLSDIFMVNTASYYVELLKLDSDEEAEQGELGRIVVTDLFNYAMPMIRYDTGDLAIKYEQSTGSVRYLKSIQGRRVDTFYDTKGNKVTAHAWSVLMWKFDKLKQYQFIQDDEKHYTLKVSGANGIYTEDDFKKTIKEVVGEDADIDIQFVDTIPVLASGKFKKTICNYIPNSNGKEDKEYS
jgi:phenylacetate-CoA ligase